MSSIIIYISLVFNFKFSIIINKIKNNLWLIYIKMIDYKFNFIKLSILKRN